MNRLLMQLSPGDRWHPPRMKGAGTKKRPVSVEYDPPLPPALTSSSLSYWGSFIYISKRQKSIRGSLKSGATMTVLSCHPKAFFFLLLVKRISVWFMYQTSLSRSPSLGQSHPSLTLRRSSMVLLAAWLMTFILYGNGGGGEGGFRCRFGHTCIPETDRHKPAGYFCGMHSL